ncbi:hypothetical protein [Phocaeicola massiliensis]|uniref:hypothetical protein n=1 Tax=Phocaeicola massiliensis TaxID=204516 RepID=UPI0018AAE63A|nr:hypothetical protein [Phocaeicola massiliensis]
MANADKWWGYMCLQTRNLPSQDEKGGPVHVIVKLHVKYADGTEAQKLLTISKYRCSKSVNLTDYQDQTVHCEKGDLVSGFMRGHIYKVGDIRFKVSDLTDTPYEGTKTVTVTVTVNPWVGVDITPEFN